MIIRIGLLSAVLACLWDSDTFAEEALGSFHAHKGEYEQALELLEAAIKLNPDAHFGREKYQVMAIRYLQALPSAAISSRPPATGLPVIVAFHGAADLAVPTRGARDSIAELRSVGYS